MTTIQKIITYSIALILSGISAYMATNIKTMPSLIILAIFVFCCVIYRILFVKEIKIVANAITGFLFCAVAFWVFLIGGYCIAEMISPSCPESGYCVMPTGQLLTGFLVSIIATPLSFLYYKKYRNQRAEIIWQIAIIIGWVIGIVIDYWLYHFYYVY